MYKQHPGPKPSPSTNSQTPALNLPNAAALGLPTAPAPSASQEPTHQPDAEGTNPTPANASVPGAESTPREPNSVAPWVPSTNFPTPKNDTISFVRNILLTNPLFPKFYADVVLTSAPNSHEAKILRPRYQKLVEKVNEKTNAMANTKTCTHIKVTGVRCGSPALYGEQFCYFHQHAHRGVRKPLESRLHPIAILEDEESIQASLMEVINALMRNTIDVRRAELILRALHIAVKNARRAKFDINASKVVREVPEYRVGTDAFVRPASAASVPSNVGTAASAVQREAQEPSYTPAPGEADELPAVAATAYKPVHPDPEFWERVERGGQILKQKEAERSRAAANAQASVGTDAFVRPASAASVPSHDFKKQPVPTTQQTNVPEAHRKVAQRFSAGNAAPTNPCPVGPKHDAVPRKPASSAPQERKNAAHRASGG